MPDQPESLKLIRTGPAQRAASPALPGASPALPGDSPALRGDSPALRGFLELVEKIDQDDPAPDDVRALRAMLRRHPQLWRVAGDLSRAAALDVVNQLGAAPAIAESLKYGRQALMDELGYQAASPLERLLIEQVALCWLGLNLVHIEYTHVMRQPISTSGADRWERRLTAAQRRYLRACDALARIRKLARTTPALQVNIAAAGGQQVNLLAANPGERQDV